MSAPVHTAKAQGRPAWAARYTVRGGTATGDLLHGTVVVREFSAPLNHDGAFVIDVRTEREEGVRIEFQHEETRV